MPKPKHILVIRLSAMGDVAMSVPVLRAFSKQYPDIKLTVLTRAFFKPFFRDLKNVSVFEADLKGRHKGVLGLYKLSKELKVTGVVQVADLHNVLRTHILKIFFFGKTFKQIDKGRNDKKALVEGKVFKQLKTTHERYADVFRGLGYSLSLENPDFPKQSTLSEYIQEIIGSDNKNWIGIAPFAQYESKMYPLDLMECVIASLSKKHKIILFGGGKKEIKVLNGFQNKYSNVVNLAGKLNLSQELDVISNLDVMLAMDSGNAHIAAMLGIKVITVWNVTHPYAGFMPYNQPKEYAITANREQFPLIPTSIYGNKYPEKYKDAARTIAPETIINTLESILK
ncbi:glycosyltransferase family 9 protein [Lacinutrix sp. MedPE-SW]|uniref:glycosyltransferase family 9 protein n=1 Tax=Lacinutrix sp. MedPE-SW TaxID=1860087 RepID=UPI0009248E2B|nr:glycosyltransferase family 9 protein [Lacinutrix sp. MedPE-SW]OIQ23525.1 MAG: ADP-heptose--LPS heptosyltransferase RfaF [Lacinutrix sp. MedPE-SW]